MGGNHPIIWNTVYRKSWNPFLIHAMIKKAENFETNERLH
jgi:hypothetical protein